MGRLGIEDMLNFADEEQALHWHLTANHFPPIHESFIPIAQHVIGRATEAVVMEDPSIWEEAVKMPNGKTMTVGSIYEGLHLDSFVDHRLNASTGLDEEDDDFEDEDWGSDEDEEDDEEDE